MAADIKVTLDPEFAKQLNALSGLLRDWDKSAVAKLERTMGVIGQRWKAEAAKRVPSDTGTLRNRILTEVFNEAGNWVCACGTNVPYGKWLEFGTKFIAGGRVQSIGEGMDVTDDQAVKDWPAKSADGTSSSEQMPWLRPALNAIRGWIIEMLIDAMKLPDQ